jgi:glutamine amidotransferase
MFEASSEGGYFEGLKLLPGRIARLDEEAPSGVVYGCKGLKIPHMGWNSLEISRRDPIYTGLPEEVFTYFDHAYCLRTNADIVSAVCEYGQTIIASVQYGHMFGLQFHPEKSGTVGLAMLQNFAKLKEVL